MINVPSHSSSQRARHLRRVVAGITKHCNRMIKTMKKSFVHRRDVENLCVKIAETLDKEVPSLVVERTNQLVKANLRRVVQEEMQKETTTSPVITLQLPSHIPIPELQKKLYTEMKENPESQAEFQSTSLEQPQQHDGWTEVEEIDDDDDDISEKASPEFMEELKEEYAYQIEKATQYMNNPIVWECREEELMAQVPVKRVHDFQLGIEIYQYKINLTAPTLIIPGIEKLESNSIISDLFIGIKILEKVLKINRESRLGFKDSPLSDVEKEVMEMLEEEI
ncbi:hypothetical protein Tco_0500362 [Tanacetum coccineum]